MPVGILRRLAVTRHHLSTPPDHDPLQAPTLLVDHFDGPLCGGDPGFPIDLDEEPPPDSIDFSLGADGCISHAAARLLFGPYDDRDKSYVTAPGDPTNVIGA